ncbi:MAG: tetratricopeptide repeat protein, partial [Betaproteobacteria bacterium]|nr:tetratricopeptide repeat protein [Betaproteobacteria bacterium]
MDDDPRTLIRQANLHRQGGRLEAAVETYQRLLRRWPQLPDSWYNLALLQRQLGWPAQALDAYQRALDHGIAQPEEVHLNRGVIYADDLRQPDAAERELDTALALNPRYVPALLNRANLCEDRGQRDAALAWYERLLSLDPGCHEALARYASLLGAASAGDPIIGRLQQAIADPAVLAAEKASLGFALGKLLDGCAAYDGAFAAYRQANEHSRASLGAGRALYDRTAHEHFVDALIRTFARPRAGGGTAMAPPPIFVCGMFRSGSTLVEQVLAGHSQVRAGGELGLLPTLVQTR